MKNLTSDKNELPLYLTVQYDLEKKIKTQDLGADNKPLSEMALCKQYGVSRTTIRQAVDELVRIGLMRREKGRGTFVCQGSTSIVPDCGAPGNGKNKVLGLIMPYLPDSIGMQIITSVEQEARKYGYRVLFRNTGNDPALTITDIDELLMFGVNGIIVYPNDTHPCDDIAIHLSNTSVPFCLLDQHPLSLSCNSVTSNNFTGGRTAGHYLLQLEHKAIGFVCLNMEQNIPTSVSDRIAGLKTACEEEGYVLDNNMIFMLSSQNISSLIDVVQQHVITGVVAANDMIGAFIINELAKHNLRVPESLSVISFDNSPVSKCTTPPLTTIAQDGIELGARAARTVIDFIEGRLKEWQHVMLPMELVIRRSTTVNRYVNQRNPLL